MALRSLPNHSLIMVLSTGEDNLLLCCLASGHVEKPRPNHTTQWQQGSKALVVKGLAGCFLFVQLGTHRVRRGCLCLTYNYQISVPPSPTCVSPTSTARDLPPKSARGNLPVPVPAALLMPFPTMVPTHQLHKPGYISLPIPFPHLQQIPPCCFPSVLTTLSNCHGKAEADLQHLLLRLVGKQKHSSREEAQSPSTPVSNCLCLQRGYRFEDTKYSTVYCVKNYKRLLSHQMSPFPFYSGHCKTMVHYRLQLSEDRVICLPCWAQSPALRTQPSPSLPGSSAIK